MIYPSKNCWPDEIDFQAVLNKHFKSMELSPVLYQDFRATFEFLREAIHACRSCGGHTRQSLPEIKTIAESYIGRVLDPTAFWAGALTASNRVSAGKSFEKITIRVPAWDDEKISVAWAQHLEELEAESNTIARSHNEPSRGIGSGGENQTEIGVGQRN